MLSKKGAQGKSIISHAGRMWSVEDVLSFFLSASRLSISVEEDPQRLRPSDVPMLCGDSCKFREETGWEPTIPFEQTLSDLLDYWRLKIRNDSNRLQSL